MQPYTPNKIFVISAAGNVLQKDLEIIATGLGGIGISVKFREDFAELPLEEEQCSSLDEQIMYKSLKQG